MTTPMTPAEPTTDACCGEGGPETPGEGKPQVVACKLCPNARGVYWRETRADGQPYREVQPLSEVND